MRRGNFVSVKFSCHKIRLSSDKFSWALRQFFEFLIDLLQDTTLKSSLVVGWTEIGLGVVGQQSSMNNIC